MNMRILKVIGFIFLLLIPVVGQGEEATSARTKITELLNSSVYNHDDRGNMPTEYKYYFSDKCHLLAHSEWFGDTHGIIKDTLIPMSGISINQEIENGAYYLYIKCTKNGCIKIDGDNTGEPFHTMAVQSFIYAGETKESYNNVKLLFHRVIDECEKK